VYLGEKNKKGNRKEKNENHDLTKEQRGSYLYSRGMRRKSGQKGDVVSFLFW
jgi:hypothetical protein